MTSSELDLETRLRAFGDVLDRASRVAIDVETERVSHAPSMPDPGRGPIGRPSRVRVAAAALAIVLVGIGALIGLRAVRDGAEPNQAPPPAVEPTSIEVELLPRRSDDSLPMVLTPSLAGWVVTTDNVAVNNRFSAAGTGVRYTLRRDADELSVGVMSGLVAVTGRIVEVDRPSGPTEASLDSTDDGGWFLQWNERPGAVGGVSVSVSGSQPLVPGEIAAALRFEERPLAGGQAAQVVRAEDAETVFAGRLGGVDWLVGPRTDGDDILVAIGGESPPITSETVTPAPDGTPAIAVTTISRDGAQVSGIVVSDRNASVSLAIGDGTQISLPTRTLPGTDQLLAVAPIPAGRDALAVIVTDGTGRETTLGLPVAPPEGWTTMAARVAPN